MGFPRVLAKCHVRSLVLAIFYILFFFSTAKADAQLLPPGSPKALVMAEAQQFNSALPPIKTRDAVPSADLTLNEMVVFLAQHTNNFKEFIFDFEDSYISLQPNLPQRDNRVGIALALLYKVRF